MVEKDHFADAAQLEEEVELRFAACATHPANGASKALSMPRIGSPKCR